MALRELQPRIKFLGFEALRRPVRTLTEGDLVERSMVGLVDDFTSATYPRIEIVVGQNDAVNVTWREGSARWDKQYALEGDQIKRDGVVRKVVQQR